LSSPTQSPENSEKRTKLEVAQKISEELLGLMSKFFEKYEVCGAVRRKRTDVGDIDIVAMPTKGTSEEDISDFIKRIDPTGQEEATKLGKSKSKRFLNGDLIKRFQFQGIMIDLYLANEDTFGTLVLIRTGSKEHNVKLNTLAREKGYKLFASGKGLWKIDRNENPIELISNTENGILTALTGRAPAPGERDLSKEVVHSEWTKAHIKELMDKISLIKNDGLDISPGNIWSVKKLLVLDYYLPSFVSIMNPNNGFFNRYYVDPFCGSGLIKVGSVSLKSERFPGSAMIAALHSQESPFTDFLLSDKSKDAIDALRKRLIVNVNQVGSRAFNPAVMLFEDAISNMESLVKRGNAFLVFIDPTGFKDVKWSLMQKILRIQTADIIFTFMTYSILKNKPIAEQKAGTKQSLTEFFGTDEWQFYDSGEALMNLYKERMETFGKQVYVIPVHLEGDNVLYHMLIATRSPVGGKIITSVMKRMEIITTELIQSSFEVVTRKQEVMTKYFG